MTTIFAVVEPTSSPALKKSSIFTNNLFPCILYCKVTIFLCKTLIIASSFQLLLSAKTVLFFS